MLRGPISGVEGLAHGFEVEAAILAFSTNGGFANGLVIGFAILFCHLLCQWLCHLLCHLLCRLA